MKEQIILIFRSVLKDYSVDVSEEQLNQALQKFEASVDFDTLSTEDLEDIYSIIDSMEEVISDVGIVIDNQERAKAIAAGDVLGEEASIFYGEICFDLEDQLKKL